MNVDMSPKAITERLRLVSQLAALCLALGKARVVEGGVGADRPTAMPLGSGPVAETPSSTR
jgi:hypothetical protein